MNELFRDPVVVDIDSLKLQRRTNEVSKEDDIGQRMEDLRNVVCANGMERIQNFTYTSVGKKYIKLLENLIR